MAVGFVTDADGTLVDTVSLIRHGQYATVCEYLVDDLRVPEDELPSYSAFCDVLHETVGGSAYAVLAASVDVVLREMGVVGCRADYDRLHGLLNPVQDRLAGDYVKPYPGLPELLFAFAETGVACAVFTSGTEHHVVRNFGIAMPELGITHLWEDESIPDATKLRIFENQIKDVYGLPAFTTVVASHTARHKPHPDGLLYALDVLQCPADTAVMLGDHKVDMATAVNAHIPTRIGITHGFDDETILREAGATTIHHSLCETADYVRAVFG